jgi:hypothetical protein
MSPSKFDPLNLPWEDPNALSTYSVVNSGAFVSVPQEGLVTPKTTETVTTFNGAMLPTDAADVTQLRLASEFTVDDALAAARQLVPNVAKSDVRVFEYFDLLMLGDAIDIAAGRVAFQRPDLVLFPLRGGFKLFRFLNAMVPNHPPFQTVLFSEAATNSNPAKDAFFLGQLQVPIRHYNLGGDLFRLHVVDVGESGKGTKKMVELLQRAHALDYEKQAWCVVFHVFHPPGCEQNFLKLQVTTQRFQAVFECYPTNTLLLDDWEPMVGLQKLRQNVPGVAPGLALDLALPAPFVQPVAVVLRHYGGYHILGSRHGAKVGDQILSYVTTDAMLSPGYLRDPSRDAWADWLATRTLRSTSR